MARRKQPKLTKQQLANMSEDYRLHNKKMRQSNNLSLCFPTFEGYLDWRFGRIPASSSVRPSTFFNQDMKHMFVRDTRNTRHSVSSKVSVNMKNATAKTESNSYSGTYVTGLATMHKSNIVPVGKGTDPKDYATMRRSN